MSVQRFWSLVHPADRRRVEAAWQAALQGAPYDIEHRIRVAGESHWVHQRAELGFDARHRPVTAQGSVQDISQRKASEQAQHLARRVFEHAREGIMITDAKAHIVDINPMFSEITGFARDEVLGRNPNILSSGRHDPQTFGALWQSLDERGNWQGELWNRRKNGELILARMAISAVHDPDTGQVLNYIGLFSDATDMRRQQERMRYLAHHDMLTDLPNRYLLMDRLQIAIARAQRHGGMLALAFIDLDGFKPINDRYGHATGDQALSEVGRRLKQMLREEDTVARLGGDEFAILFSDQTERQTVSHMVDRLLQELSAPYRIDAHEFEMSASIGVALYPSYAQTADQLLLAADLAMYNAKNQGRNRASFQTGPVGKPPPAESLPQGGPACADHERQTPTNKPGNCLILSST